MLTRSRSSVKDQALYTPVRVDHLQNLSSSESSSGQKYKSLMRVGIGNNAIYIHFLFDLGIPIPKQKLNLIAMISLAIYNNAQQIQRVESIFLISYKLFF